jgi:DNA polymerase-3 subunit beta
VWFRRPTRTGFQSIARRSPRRSAAPSWSVDKVRSVRVDLSAEKVTVTAHSQEHGEGAEEVPAVFLAETITDMAIGFNAKLLLDTFAAMGGDELEVRLADPAAPALFINPADDAAQWVVMPMRV